MHNFSQLLEEHGVSLAGIEGLNDCKSLKSCLEFFGSYDSVLGKGQMDMVRVRAFIFNVIDAMGARRDNVRGMFRVIDHQFFSAPASSNKEYHGAMDGGLALHCCAVLTCMVGLNSFYGFGESMESLAFCALFHDLGKIGMVGKPWYTKNPSNWHVENQGKIYTADYKTPCLPHDYDRSLFLLQQFGIPVSETEYQAIRYHALAYEEGGLRNHEFPLTLLTHWADLYISRIPKT